MPFYIVRQLVCLLLSLLAFGRLATAQSLSLNPTTFYPDSSIIHTGTPVSWTGSLVWTLSANTAYSLTYTFGDGGSGYSISKSTGGSAWGKDTFQAVHTYAAPGSYTAKVILKDASGTPIDSLLRPFTAGSGYAISGRFYYDCIQNCHRDTPELGVYRAFMGVKINQLDRTCWTDSQGYFNLAVAAGDTFRKGTIVPDFPNTYIPTAACHIGDITATNRSVNIAVRLNDAMYMDNFQSPDLLCMGGFFMPSVQTHAPGGGMPRVRYSYGDGWVSGFVWASDGNNYHAYAYSAKGDYTLTLDLFNTNYDGPYMRYQRQIHVDSCRKLILDPYHDADKSCSKDTSELVLNTSSVDVFSKKAGRQTIWWNAGHFEYLILPGDTVKVDTSVYVGTWNMGDYVKQRMSCAQGTLHAGTPDTATIPFENHHKLRLQFTPSWKYCYADTIILGLTGELIGYPQGSSFEILAFYDDGHSDTARYTFSQDTMFNHEIRHRYDTSGIRNCVFVLRSQGGDLDTVKVQLTVDDCFPVFVQAFYDRNRNCVKDPGESFATDFQVKTGSSGTFSSNTSNRTVLFYQYTPADSVLSIYDVSQATHGSYDRTGSNRAGCSWPALNAAGATHLLPLTESPDFAITYHGDSIGGCSGDYEAELWAYVLPNYGHTYTLHYFYGNGLDVDTVSMGAVGYLYHPVPLQAYQPGTWVPAVRIFDDSTGALVFKQSLKPFTIWDTCSGKGQLFADADANCSYDSTDVPIAGQVVRILSGGATILKMTDSAGRFFTTLSGGSDSVQIPDTLSARLIPSCGTALTTELDSGVNISFPYTCVAGFDLRILAAHHYFRDSTADTLILYPAGYLCNDDSGTLSLSLPAGLSFTGSDLPGAIVGSSGVVWKIDSLSKLPSVIRVGLQLSLPAVVPTLCLSVSLQGTLPDPVPANNDFYLCDSVRSAIPAFYKSQSSDSMTADGILVDGKEIVYSLRIRNVSATDTVRSILLYDSLDAALDVATLHVLDATFAFKANLLPGAVLQVSGSGAMELLPGEEVAIRFGIRPYDTLTPGAMIRNRISVTLSGVPEGGSNEVVAMRATPGTSVAKAPGADRDIRVYPNPASDAFFIAVAGADVQGQYQLLDPWR